RTTPDIAQRTAGAHDELHDDAITRHAGWERMERRRRPLAATRSGNAADMRAEACRRVVPANEPAEEYRRVRGRDPGVHRAAEGADEADVDASARQLGV